MVARQSDSPPTHPLQLPAASSSLPAALAAFNARWHLKLCRFRQLRTTPWWAPGLIITLEIRTAYELYLPIGEYFHDLRRLAVLCLPHPSWVPSVLQRPDNFVYAAPVPAYPSLADFWAASPEAVAGRLQFSLPELWPLFCTLADPPRFGTNVERYPDQLDWLRQWLVRVPRQRLRLLDLGCGTGHGTFELAALIQDCGVRRVSATGVTREVLEVWMAKNRFLPHDSARTQTLCRIASRTSVCPEFLVGDIEHLPLPGQFDLIVSNGLVGGRFLNRPDALIRLLVQLEQLLAPGGVVSLANSFHAGCEAPLRIFRQLARARGWQVAGERSTHLRLNLPISLPLSDQQ
jgi:SAM-dependent methyltransferase